MDSIDLPFESFIKPYVSAVRHLGLPCRRGCTGLPPYGFHKNLTVSTKPAKKTCPKAYSHTICKPQSIKLQGGTGSRARHATYIPTCSSNHFVQNHWESMEICSRTLSLRIMIPKFGLDLTERGVVGMVETSQRNPC